MLGWLLEAVARRIEEPAVIWATEALRLDDAPQQVRVPVGAELLDQTVIAGSIPERDQMLTQQRDRPRRMVVELLDRCERQPVATHQLTHRRARANVGESIVLFFSEHSVS